MQHINHSKNTKTTVTKQQPLQQHKNTTAAIATTMATRTKLQYKHNNYNDSNDGNDNNEYNNNHNTRMEHSIQKCLGTSRFIGFQAPLSSFSVHSLQLAVLGVGLYSFRQYWMTHKVRLLVLL
jgi:hypothetical protein